jgi:hypothetical protein
MFLRDDDHGEITIRRAIANTSREAHNRAAIDSDRGTLAILNEAPESGCIADAMTPAIGRQQGASCFDFRGCDCPDFHLTPNDSVERPATDAVPRRRARNSLRGRRGHNDPRSVPTIC